MLREISTVRAHTRNKKRWFSDSDMDLFVWFRNQMPIQFQLSYNKQYREHAISWDNNSGFRSSRVDTGEQRSGRYKMTPLLVGNDEVDCRLLAREFLQHSDNLEPTLADFIYARLLEYPDRKPA